MKEGIDGAEPSVNSVSALNLMRLGSLFEDAPYRAQGERTLRAFGDQIRRSPSSFPQMLVAADWMRSPPRQIVIAGRADGPDTRALLDELNWHFIPKKVVILAEGGAGQQYFARQLDFFRALPASPPSPALAYVCQDFTCRLPTSDIAAFAGLLAPAKAPDR